MPPILDLPVLSSPHRSPGEPEAIDAQRAPLPSSTVIRLSIHLSTTYSAGLPQ